MTTFGPRFTVLFPLLLLLAACSVSKPMPMDASADTLGTDALNITPEMQLTEVDILAVNDDMRAFLNEHVPKASSNQRKVELILQAILEEGLSLDYNAFQTLTAEQAFYQREGNCLSFTNLFVALAREVGLDAEYQEVDVPPSWDRLGNNHLFNRHINVRVRLPFEGEQAVDFNMTDFDVEYRRKRVSDEYALALYHNNMAVYWLGEKQLEQAYLHARRAIELKPEADFFWTNLGTVHRRSGDDVRAEAAWREAVRLGDEPSAISNLARLYERQGRDELAREYADVADSYRQKNPYYLYSISEEAYDAGDYTTAISILRRAVRIRDNEHEFYRLMGLSHLQLGNKDAALRNFQLAEDVAASEEDRARYNQKQRLMAQIAN